MIEPEGEEISKTQLTNPKAIAFYDAIEKSDYCEIIRLRKNNEYEIIIFKTEVEKPQYPVHDIKRFENISISFHKDDLISPKVYSLREDFPLVPHINLWKKEFPRWLCIHEESYEDLKLNWNPSEYLERIRTWLALTAKGKLHQEDQYLEPLLLPSLDIIVIPRDYLFIKTDIPIPLVIKQVTSGTPSRNTYITEEFTAESSLKDVLLTITVNPQIHGVIKQTPNNIFELNELLSDFDLIGHLRKVLLKWSNDYNFGFNPRITLLVNIPTKRDNSDENDIIIPYVFRIDSYFNEIGNDIGLWDYDKKKVTIRKKVAKSKNGSNLKIHNLNPHFTFDSALGKLSNGLSIDLNTDILMVGVGAVGSHVFNNMLRKGFEKWILVDPDIFVPHNLARHTLLNMDIGFTKVGSLEIHGKALLKESNIKSFDLNVIENYSTNKELADAIDKSPVILDTAASVTVSRFLAHDINTTGRIISLFLNPSGKNGIMLMEDTTKVHTIDYLEMVYYRLVFNTNSLHSHFKRDEGELRYGNSCRDMSVKISLDDVSIFSAIFSKTITKNIESADARVRIWAYDENENKIDSFDGEIYNVQNICKNSWKLVTDEYVTEKLRDIRLEKLPNETGGVLLGYYDMARKIIYVIDCLPAPPDSQERPYYFKRGCRGLTNKINNYNKITSGVVDYIGEWHSHPEGCSARSSDDDKTAFRILQEIMDKQGLPTLMTIIGEDIEFYINKI